MIFLSDRFIDGDRREVNNSDNTKYCRLLPNVCQLHNPRSPTPVQVMIV
ncbi:MAG: hypothetical protein HXY43_04680 [Fischerella sp.]|nr:hypothetical protein [Fischerella sp.]NWF58611.1 hypothetical protein [Fischerella sp.]